MGEVTSGGASVGPPFPFDAELDQALPAIRSAMPAYERLEDIPLYRQHVREQAADPSLLTREGRVSVDSLHAPGPKGGPEVRLLILRPTSAAPSPMPVLYYIHGGGMIHGDCEHIPDEVVDWVHELGVAVVSVEYRLAPETPHPGPVEDCFAGLLWLAANGGGMGMDTGRILIGGTSAGGGLAAATTLLARDRGGPSLMAQMLLCPMLDDRNDSPSAIQGEGRGVWDRRANALGWTALLGDRRGTHEVSPHAAPARAQDLAGLPRTYIDVGSAETFRDEVLTYAAALWRHGVDAELHVFAGGFHAYDLLAPEARISHDTRRARRGWLDRLLRS